MKKRNSVAQVVNIIKELHINEDFDNFVSGVERILFSDLSYEGKFDCLLKLISVYRSFHPKR